ncbi:MAG: hypothetical protein AMXMBFR22_01850 [Phycisphaerae bacterium]
MDPTALDGPEAGSVWARLQPAKPSVPAAYIARRMPFLITLDASLVFALRPTAAPAPSDAKRRAADEF